jgi:23S rRNA (cytidine1920-2'-O)/16S rRNA (cytidine1409-2'-O)-methyltransferase
MANRRVRLDDRLLELGLAGDLTEARGLIMAGRVVVGGVVQAKPGSLTPLGEALHVRGTKKDYVSRGGYKLAHALLGFGIQVEGLLALDAGASAGGFTDCLLKHGAARVYAVDAGFAQIHSRLANDSRVVVLERTNISQLSRGSFERAPEFCCADLSYLSLALAVPILEPLLASNAELVCLIKPLYEGLSQTAPQDLPQIREVLVRLFERLNQVATRSLRDVSASPILGGRGALEFLLWLSPRTSDAPPSIEDLLERALTSAASQRQTNSVAERRGNR